MSFMPVLGRPRQASRPKEGCSRVSLEPEVADILRFAAEEEHKSTSEFIRACVELYMQIHQPGWSFSELLERAQTLRQKKVRTFVDRQMKMFPNIKNEEPVQETQPEPNHIPPPSPRPSNAILIFAKTIAQFNMQLGTLSLTDRASIEELYSTAKRINSTQADQVFEKLIQSHIQAQDSCNPTDILMNVHRYI